MRQRLIIGALLVFTIAMSACDYMDADWEPVEYSNNIVQFSYHGSWKLSEGDIPGELKYVIIDGPSSTEVVFQIYPVRVNLDLEDYARWFSTEFKNNIRLGEIDNVSFTPIKEEIDGAEVDGVRETFTLKVFGLLDAPHQRDYFAVRGETSVVFLVFQVSDHDLGGWAEKIERLKQSIVVN